jgi:hypothetical protein
MSDKAKRKTAELSPVKTIRRGAIAASIWRRQAPTGFEYYDFSISRSWKSKSSGKEGYSSNFFTRNAEDLAAVAEEAAVWIEENETEESVSQVNGGSHPTPVTP